MPANGAANLAKSPASDASSRINARRTTSETVSLSASALRLSRRTRSSGILAVKIFIVLRTVLRDVGKASGKGALRGLRRRHFGAASSFSFTLASTSA